MFKKSICLFGMTILLSACGSSLPDCKSGDTVELVEEIVNGKTYLLGRFIALDDIQEKAFNKEKEIRLCYANLLTTKGSEEISYSIRWSNKEKGEFWVEIN